MTGKVETQSGQRSNQPELYEIRFKGHLSSCQAQVFEGLEMIQGPDGDTVLTGPVIDQAALHGVLSRIRDLGLPLLLVKRLSAARGGPRAQPREDRPAD